MFTIVHSRWEMNSCWCSDLECVKTVRVNAEEYFCIIGSSKVMINNGE
jgi:hypothetical protein